MKTHREIKTTSYDRQLSVVCRLGVDCTPDYVAADPDELLGFVKRVLDEERITYGDFVELDERPGQYPGGYAGLHGEWHFRLRQWRNTGGTHTLWAHSREETP